MEETIQAHQKALCTKLWAMANALRGNMEAYEFKNYILGMIFYYYLSDRTEKYMAKNLKHDGMTYEEAWKNSEYHDALYEISIGDLGYVIEPKNLFRKMVDMVANGKFDIEFLQGAINSLMESTLGTESQDDFDGLFSDMQLDSTKLGHTVKERSKVMAEIISAIDGIEFSVEDTKIDILGNAYEYLIGQFAATAGKKAGEFYTPSGPAELLCRLACLGLTNVKDAADPACGSGSLLLRLKKYANVRNYYGQELTSTTYNLARMNMILRGIGYKNFEINNGDTLENDMFGERKFRVQVANPPYSSHWSSAPSFMEDERFNAYGKLAPKSKADFAFVQHMVWHMDDDGRAVVLLPHGVLFRGDAECVIRRHLIEKMNVLDAVIGLPANLFFGTGIPVCVLVLKRDRGAMPSNFAATIPDAALARKTLAMFRDEYLLDFVNLDDIEATGAEDVDERVVEKSIVANIKKFIMTFGRDFSFIGNQYRLEVEGHELFVDLLFFNRELNALVAVELKKGGFKPAYLGQLHLYLQALEDNLKKPHENPPVGIILCKSADKAFVEYTVRDFGKPMGVATYRTADEMPEDLKRALPPIDELRRQLAIASDTATESEDA